MKLEPAIYDEGFNVFLRSGGERTRFVMWQASAGDRFDSGRLDVSMLGKNQGLPIHLGWKPEKITFAPVRDATPGMHQHFISNIPAGVALLEFVAESGISGTYELQVSATGQPFDTRSMGSLPTTGAGQVAKVKIVMRTSWIRVFIKKMSDTKGRLAMSRFKLTMGNGDTYHSMAHLIKPEGDGITKIGKDGIVFAEDAPKWCYANIAFQRF